MLWSDRRELVTQTPHLRREPRPGSQLRFAFPQVHWVVFIEIRTRVLWKPTAEKPHETNTLSSSDCKRLLVPAGNGLK